MNRLFLMGISMMLLSSCASGIKYQEARNYFVNSNAPQQTSTKITSQQEFDRFFGMATTMAKDGKPTKVDFTKQFVVPIILPVTDQATEIKDVKIKKSKSAGAGDNLLVTYRVDRGEHRSFSIQPCRILILDNQWKNSDVEVKEVR